MWSLERKYKIYVFLRLVYNLIFYVLIFIYSFFFNYYFFEVQTYFKTQIKKFNKKLNKLFLKGNMQHYISISNLNWGHQGMLNWCSLMRKCRNGGHSSDTTLNHAPNVQDNISVEWIMPYPPRSNFLFSPFGCGSY